MEKRDQCCRVWIAFDFCGYHNAAFEASITRQRGPIRALDLRVAWPHSQILCNATAIHFGLHTRSKGTVLALGKDMVTQHLRSKGRVIGQDMDLSYAGQNNLSPSEGLFALST